MAVVTGPTNSMRRIRQPTASIPRTLGTEIMNQLQAMSQLTESPPDSAAQKVIYRTIAMVSNTSWR